MAADKSSIMDLSQRVPTMSLCTLKRAVSLE